MSLKDEIYLKGSSMTADNCESIALPYLLVLMNLPCHVTSNGRRYVDPLLAKDLVEHTRYLTRLSLATPCRFDQPPNRYVATDTIPELSKIIWINLPAPQSMLQALWYLPSTMLTLWRQLGSARVVHSDVASWPIPGAWLLAPLLFFRPRFYLIIVESALWRLMPGFHYSWRKKLRSGITEYLNRACLLHVDLAFFTQDEYRRSLPPRYFELGHVIHASWVDEAVILSQDELLSSWQMKVAGGTKPLRIAFAGRLTEAKGVLVLLMAIEELAAEGVPIELNILGEGELQSSCREASSRMPQWARIQLCESIPYGEHFFAWLRQAHFVIVPSVSDEQPRIVYDAYSQGLPVVASRTAGLLDCVTDGLTGKLVPAGNHVALKEAIRWAADNPKALAEMGISAAQRVRGMTHQLMHRTRLSVLNDALAKTKKLGLHLTKYRKPHEYVSPDLTDDNVGIKEE